MILLAFWGFIEHAFCIPVFMKSIIQEISGESYDKQIVAPEQ